MATVFLSMLRTESFRVVSSGRQQFRRRAQDGHQFRVMLRTETVLASLLRTEQFSCLCSGRAEWIGHGWWELGYVLWRM